MGLHVPLSLGRLGEREHTKALSQHILWALQLSVPRNSSPGLESRQSQMPAITEFIEMMVALGKRLSQG